MAEITYYVALPFDRNEEGVLVPGEAVESPSHNGALSRARGLALKHTGALAFSRIGDPNIGEFRDAEVIAKFGEVPDDLSEL